MVKKREKKISKEEECTFDDFFDEWNKLFMSISDKNAFSFEPMTYIAEQFRKGVATELPVHMDTYIKFVIYTRIQIGKGIQEFA